MEGTRIRLLAPAALIAFIEACEDASQVVAVMDEPIGSFIMPKITLSLFLYILAIRLQKLASTEFG